MAGEEQTKRAAGEHDDWRSVKQEIDTAVDAVWTNEPDEVKLIRWGIIRSGAGSGGQSFTGLVHLEVYTILLGQHLLHGLLVTARNSSIDLNGVCMLTREFTTDTFNSFEFLGDLGLDSMRRLGRRYRDALESLQSKEDFVELTSSLLTYVTRMQRWVHFTFPWNLGLAFPQRQPGELNDVLSAVAEAEKHD